MSAPTGSQQGPSLPWRATSSLVMGVSSCISKAFLFGFNRTEVYGLQRFLDILDSRADPSKRQRGLVTVSNHISVLDDPVMWSVLPLGYTFKPPILRWGLGAHDICFKNQLFANFFTYGQVLPTHRLKHSQHGGLFQPTFTEAIRLLSSPSAASAAAAASSVPSSSDEPSPRTLPYHTPFPRTYSTNGQDVVPLPSIHPINRYSWVHVFPEGAVHQHPSLDMRYFKWGISRLILESEPMPDVVPIFIDGFQHVMPEDRRFPRFLPRIGNNIRIAFGDVLDSEAVFGDLRKKWRELVRKRRNALGKSAGEEVLGEVRDEQLREGPEAREIRIEVARRVRREVMRLRRQMGYPEGDPTLEDAETWAKEKEGKKYRSAVDGSLINQD